ncbi:SWIM zinc finger domain-containing protein [Leptolyngbya sp. FACHB-261]|uniref:SWIM zinc finger family protein n=1 Tax=Leptolyngbya sp. FACHB-261 TaxID=2692806 RepID=UPI001687166F|nr:SWIM zinc finger family protein [Leptolyngbya sp. FACHB-261]MBD2101898.1 SWIM zinc finger family protein [Leptolyngbya sp. FACHB-261]
MPATWTTEQILALAPDASSAKAGKSLATLRKWQVLGQNEQVIWGECQGSGKNPYQAQIELSEPAFRCSCPSRKFPCKHGLGLLLLFEAQTNAFIFNSPPAWVTAWLASRSQRAEKQAQKQAQKERSDAVADPAAQARRLAQRQAKLTAGLQDLERWLQDLIRHGLATAQNQPYSFWDGPAARLVDAQAPGLARQLREMAGIPRSGTGWPDRLLERLGRVHLLIEGFRRLEALPPNVQADIRAGIGWTQKLGDGDQGPSDGVQSQSLIPNPQSLVDRWSVLGQRTEDQERLRVQRTWLWGQNSGQSALSLHFAVANQPLDTSLIPGTCLEAELAFYPSNYPLRALVQQRQGLPLPLDDLPGYSNLGVALAEYAKALACNPWLEQFPLALNQVIPLRQAETWAVRDETGHLLPLAPNFVQGWQLLALSGGQPLSLFGEWNGETLLPLSAWAEGRFIRF